MKIRLLWKVAIEDSAGRCVGHRYKTDVITLPDDAQALQFDYHPELIGCEWLVEENKPEVTK